MGTRLVDPSILPNWEIWLGWPLQVEAAEGEKVASSTSLLINTDPVEISIQGSAARSFDHSDSLNGSASTTWILCMSICIRSKAKLWKPRRGRLGAMPTLRQPKPKTKTKAPPPHIPVAAPEKKNKARPWPRPTVANASGSGLSTVALFLGLALQPGPEILGLVPSVGAGGLCGFSTS